MTKTYSTNEGEILELEVADRKLMQQCLDEIYKAHNDGEPIIAEMEIHFNDGTKYTIDEKYDGRLINLDDVQTVLYPNAYDYIVYGTYEIGQYATYIYVEPAKEYKVNEPAFEVVNAVGK